MQAYSSTHIQQQSWGGYLTAGVSVSVSYPSNTTANITVTGRCGFYWIDAWSNSSITVTLGGVSGSGSYSGAIYGGTGNESYIVDSSEYASKTFTVNRGTSNTNYTGYCTLTVGGQTSVASYTVTVNKIPYSACGAPTSVSASGIITPSGSFTVSWSGASGGTSNAISSYQVYYKVSSNGAAPTTSDYTGTVNVASTATSGSKTITLSSATRGYKVVCGVVTRGAAGSSYYSGIKTGGSVTINSLPATPSITSPTAATNTYISTTASVDITVSPGADTDSSQTTSVWYATSATGTKTQVTNNTLTVSMIAGTSYTRYFWTYDGLEYSSNYASVTVRRNSAPSLSLGTATNTAKSCGVSSFDNTKYIVGVTLPITGTKGTYGSASTLYYRVVYDTIGGTNNNPSYTSVTTTSGTAYNLTLNLNSIIGAPNKQWYIEYYYHDGIQGTDHAFYPAKSGSTINYYYLAPNPEISVVYNRHADSNISGTNANQFYRNVRLRFGYDTDLTGLTKVTYAQSGGNEVEATLVNYTYNASSGTNYVDVTVPDGLFANTNYIFRIYLTNGAFTKIVTSGNIRETPLPSFVGTGIQESHYNNGSPTIFYPYTYSNASQTFICGIAGVSDSSFFTTYNLDSSSCFTISLVYENSEITYPTGSPTYTTDTATFTFNYSNTNTTNVNTLLTNIKSLFNDYNSQYSCKWKIKITNRFGKAVEFISTTNYPLSFIEPLSNQAITVKFGNASSKTTLTANNSWRAQESGVLEFVLTCSTYNTAVITCYPRISRRDSSGSSHTWSQYMPTQVTTRSGSVSYLTPYSCTSTFTYTLGEISTSKYCYFSGYFISALSTVNDVATSASYYTQSIAHTNTDGFTLISSTYSETGTTYVYGGQFNLTNKGIPATNSAYTITTQTDLLLDQDNSWSSIDKTYTNITVSGSASPYTYSYTANEAMGVDRYFTKIKYTTTINQTVGSVTISVTKISYTEPAGITYNTSPTLAYRKNSIGINTDTVGNDAIIDIHGASGRNKIAVTLGATAVTTNGYINLDDGLLNGFVVNGGTWTSTIDRILVKTGSPVPTTSNLASYEVGYATSNQTLYINDNGTIRPLGNSALAQMALTGDFNVNNITVTNNLQVNTINGDNPAQIIFGTSAPSKTTNILWIDTTSSMYIPKVYYSSAWHPLGASFS